MAVCDAVVLAGTPADHGDYTYDLLAAEGVQHKGLLRVDGHALLDRVLDALLASRWIGRVHVVGLRTGSEQLERGRHPRVRFDPGGDTYAANVLRGCELAGTDLVLFTAGDLPLLSTEIVDEFFERCRQREPGDLYCALTPLHVARAHWPPALYRERHYYRYSCVDLMANTDLFLTRAAVVSALCGYLEKTRSSLRGVSTIALMMTILKWRGLGLLWKYLCRRLELNDIESAFERIMGGFRLRLVVLEKPGANFDIDRVEHLQAVREYLRARA